MKPVNENHANHIKLWTWLSENPSKRKEDYFIENKIKDVPLLNCYACKEVECDCMYCPIEWGSNIGKGCTDLNSIYNKWNSSYYNEERSKLAKKIAEMEWRVNG